MAEIGDEPPQDPSPSKRNFDPLASAKNLFGAPSKDPNGSQRLSRKCVIVT